MIQTKRVSLAIFVATALASSLASAGAIRPGFSSSSLAANDDGSTGPVAGLPITVYGTTYNSAYINNNGNITGTSASSVFNPFPLSKALQLTFAPFFADVDTSPAGSGIVKYGVGFVDGHLAFGVTWPGVGYYDDHVTPLNKFQAIIISRSDIASGAYDIEFNYDQIQWESGDASGGSGGLGGNSARAGWSAGPGKPSYEIPGAGIPGAYLDSNTTTGLIHNSRNSSVLGRYVFQLRDGMIDGIPVPEPSTWALTLIGAVTLFAGRRRFSRRG